jgi:hypothetical protein
MPGYGIARATEGRGLLPWSWAEERLTMSHDYWVATVAPAGRSHLMPVWGVWLDDAWWFSSSLRSRKARNIAVTGRCTASTDNAFQPVVLERPVDQATDQPRIERFLAATNAKYHTDYELDFLDPAVNATFRVVPDWVFTLDEADFAGSPTRWMFDLE